MMSLTNFLIFHFQHLHKSNQNEGCNREKERTSYRSSKVGQSERPLAKVQDWSPRLVQQTSYLRKGCTDKQNHFTMSKDKNFIKFILCWIDLVVISARLNQHLRKILQRNIVKETLAHCVCKRRI